MVWRGTTLPLYKSENKVIIFLKTLTSLFCNADAVYFSVKWELAF